MNFKYYKTNNLIAFVPILTILLTLFYNQFEGLISSNETLKDIFETKLEISEDELKNIMSKNEKG